MPNQHTAAAVPSTPDTARSLISAYLDGETMTEIAQQHGVTRPRLYKILLEHAPEQWRDAQVAHAVERLEEAKKGIDSAPDALALSRARESARVAQWELERLLKRLYGPSAEITGKDGGPITVELVQFAGRTIEGDAATQEAETVSPKQLPTR